MVGLPAASCRSSDFLVTMQLHGYEVGVYSIVHIDKYFCRTEGEAGRALILVGLYKAKTWENIPYVK